MRFVRCTSRASHCRAPALSKSGGQKRKSANAKKIANIAGYKNILFPNRFIDNTEQALGVRLPIIS